MDKKLLFITKLYVFKKHNYSLMLHIYNFKTTAAKKTNALQSLDSLST